MTIHFQQVPATFIHIPKTAGTSVSVWANNNSIPFIASDEENKHCTLEKAKQLFPNTGTVFTIVRNPHDRMVSLFFHVKEIVEKHMKISMEKIKEGNLLPADTHEQIKIIGDCRRILTVCELGFNNWITGLLTNAEELQNQLSPTTNLCKLIVGELTIAESQASWFNGKMPDIVICMEDLKWDFIKIQDLLGCVAPLPRVNTSTHADYRYYYSEESFNLLARAHAEDFKIFGYSACL